MNDAPLRRALLAALSSSPTVTMVPGVARRVLLPRLVESSPFAPQTTFVPSSSPFRAAEPRILQSRLYHASFARQSPLPPFSVATFRSSAPASNALLRPSNLHDRLLSRHGSVSAAVRQFSTTSRLLEQVQTKIENAVKTKAEVDEDSHKHEFAKSERATRAAQVNLSARLSKEGKGSGGGKAGFGEVWRLIKIARPELRWLSVAFVFLVISSSVTMSIPFSVGRILDLATKGEAEDVRLLGLTMNQFFFGLGTILTLGAMANFGRVVLLRIVGERVVARLRSQLYRRTYVQDAEFFDANRVGDLISRLSSDTVIVGKSVTQNISDGLRALFSGGAGFAIMVWTSPQLTGLLLLMFPPSRSALLSTDEPFATSADRFRRISELSPRLPKSVLVTSRPARRLLERCRK